WHPERPDASLQALVPAKIPADTAKTLGPLGGDVTLALARGGMGEGMIGFVGGERRTTSRLLDGDFPKVRNLLPDHHNAQAKMPVAGLVEVVRRVALVAERTTPVRLSFSEDGLVVEAGGSASSGWPHGGSSGSWCRSSSASRPSTSSRSCCRRATW